MYKYYQLGDVVYFADEATKVTEGSVEVTKQAFDDYMKSIQPPRSWTPKEFMKLFSNETRLKITQLAMTNAQVKMWYDEMMVSPRIVEGDKDLTDGFEALIQAGGLTQQDIDNALA